MMIVVAIVAMLLGAGRMFYQRYIWGQPVTRSEELESRIGQRVSLSGTYHSAQGKTWDGYVIFQGCAISVNYCSPEPANGQLIAIAGTLYRVPDFHRSPHEPEFFLLDLRRAP